MIYRQTLLAALCGILASAVQFSAQTPKRGTQQTTRRAPAGPVNKPAGPSNQPVARERGPQTPASVPNGALAIVNGQPIMPSDIEGQVRAIIGSDSDPYLQSFFENPEQEIAAARRRAFDARVSSLLIEAEARRRNIPTDRLIEAEVNSRIPVPNEADIQATYQANRAQLGGSDLESVRPQIVSYLRSKSAEQLYAELVQRLRMTNTVTKGADVNAPNLAPGTVLVKVGGKEFTAGMLDERLKSYVYKLRLRVFQAQQRALDQKINDMLLLNEAQRRNVPPENIIREEITNKFRHPTEADVSKFYAENKERINATLEASRADIISYLEQQEQERLERALSQNLRSHADVRVLLREPEAVVQSISVDDDPARGDPNAAVTVVEFTDFQCPACGAMYPVLEEALKPYGNRVRFVVRDFPLDMHENARKAAEAAGAANAQGKFFEYIALLFRNQKTLDVASLKKYAVELGLDRARFERELDSGMYAAEVRHDIEDGELYGVDSTPSIFVNGVRLQDLSAEGIHAAIERAFARAGQAANKKTTDTEQ